MSSEFRAWPLDPEGGAFGRSMPLKGIHQLIVGGRGEKEAETEEEEEEEDEEEEEEDE
jgi:hypothetical protein